MQNIVREKRKAKLMTQQELAEAIGISRPNLSLIETGEAIPRGDTMIRIAQSLDCPVESIFFASDVNDTKQKGD